jgi:thermitase
MAPPSDKAPASVQPAYVIPDCGCGGKECIGPEPVPWLSWKHCFKFYEFRYATVPLERAAATNIGRLVIRVRYEHAFCLIGRKQGPIVHSLTLLPKEVVRIYEYDRYRRATSATSRFSVRSSFFTLTQRVQDTYSSTKTEGGTSFSTSSSATASGGGGIDLGIVSFGGGSSVSGSVNASAHFDVASVSERFSHIAETSSLAVETERSVVVSTFEETESGQSTARTLRNDNECRAVTYFIRRVFEVYTLSTRIVSIEAQVGDTWIDVAATPAAIQEEIKRFLGKINVGGRADPKVEIALPTDGLLYEAELAHCCSCDCEHEAKSYLELEKLQLENRALRLEADRRQKRLDAGELDPFEPGPAPADDTDDD